MPNRSISKFDIENILVELSKERPIFHSEADFQHALAWKIHEMYKGCKIRLEIRPDKFTNRYVDIKYKREETIFIELKYRTKGFQVQIDDESFSLKNQGANDQVRYSFWKDVSRIEDFTRIEGESFGFAVIVTNDSKYWEHQNRNTNDENFKIFQNREVSETLRWQKITKSISNTSFEPPIKINNKYECSWKNYSKIGGENFKFLALEIPPGTRAETQS